MPASEPSQESTRPQAADLRFLADALQEAARRMELPPPDGAYHIVVVPDQDPARLVVADTAAAAVEALRELRAGPRCQVFVVKGVALAITQGGDYLLEGSTAYPLVVAADPGPADLSGFMGSAFAPPSTQAAPAAVALDDAGLFGEPEDPFDLPAEG